MKRSIPFLLNLFVFVLLGSSVIYAGENAANVTLVTNEIADVATQTDCSCNGQSLLNGSFENSKQSGSDKLSDWQYSGKFTKDDNYEVCGKYIGLLTGGGSFWQESGNVVPGSNVTFTVMGGYHYYKDHFFKLIFIGSDNEELLVVSKQLTKSVNEAGGKLTKYTLTGVAPEGTIRIKVKGISTGDYFKVDAACLSIVKPVVECSDCVDNKLLNASFEETKWLNNQEVPKYWVGNNFVKDAAYITCGSKTGLIGNGGSFYQDVQTKANSKVSLKIWAGYHHFKEQKIEIQFFSATGTEPISTVSVSLDKSVDELNGKLKLYKLDALSPDGTAYVRIKGSSKGDYFKVDAACLTILESSLPVKLLEFKAGQSERTVKLSWSTTAETNSGSFEVQQSTTGKSWQILGTVQAMGESSSKVDYHLVQDNPSTGPNLYRLKMIDTDGTFAYSSIVSVNIKGDWEIEMYPNPVTDYLTVKSSVHQVANVMLFNSRGQLVRNVKPDAADQIDLTGMEAGRYVVKIKDVVGTITTKRILVTN